VGTALSVVVCGASLQVKSKKNSKVEMNGFIAGFSSDWLEASREDV
jgi:hypothetical protein